jgi:hypothetical protein
MTTVVYLHRGPCAGPLRLNGPDNITAIEITHVNCPCAYCYGRPLVSHIYERKRKDFRYHHSTELPDFLVHQAPAFQTR